MSKTVAICTMIVAAGLLATIAIVHPEYISDKNSFLKEFIGANLLNVLGVILAISLASAAQLHLEFNKVEERYQKRGLEASRSEVRGGAAGLIVLFTLSIIVLVVKPIVAHDDTSQAWFNGSEIWIVLMNVLLLFDLISAAFSIKADIKSD